MWAQLAALEKRFEELNHRLAQSEVASDPTLFGTLNKERAELQPVVETFRRYRKVLEEIESNEGLSEDNEPEIRHMAHEELVRLRDDKVQLEGELRLLLVPRDPRDNRNAILEIRAGTGGEEAALFAADLFRMYSRYAESKRWRVELVDSNTTGLKGLREVILLVSGKGVYGGLKYEAGVHRVQRVPQTEASGRIHTSAVTVAVLPEVEEVDATINENDLQVDVFRSSGPGGQGVNTTDSAVRITHHPSGIVVVCRDERSQMKNRAKAMKILRARLYEQEQERQAAEIRESRRAMVGTGDRSEKIRTYNFPQNRMTDHRIGLTLHKLDQVLDGRLEEVVEALRAREQEEALKAISP